MRMLALLFLLCHFIISPAQTQLRLSKQEIITIKGTPDSLFADKSGFIVMHYVIKKNNYEAVNMFRQQTSYFLVNGKCKKIEHFMPSWYYTIQAAYFDRAYACADDSNSAAWVTGSKTFYRMKISGAFAIYTEETFE